MPPQTRKAATVRSPQAASPKRNTRTTKMTTVDNNGASGPAVRGQSPEATLPAAMEHDVELVHAAELARTRELLADLRQQPHPPPYLDALFALVEKRDNEDGDGDDDTTSHGLARNRKSHGNKNPDYHAALHELEYLEGLFKKLRFSYREQLTKETVVRRILELELPLLGAADIDRMVQDTEAERRRLRASKAGAQAQGAAAEQLLRALVDERRYLAQAERETAQLPERLRTLRHQLARLTLALRAELAAIDQLEDEAAGGPAGKTITFPCAACGRSFYAEAFLQAHTATQHKNTRGAEEDEAMDVDVDVDAAGKGHDDALLQRPLPTPLPLRRCRGCDQHVPAALVEAAPPGETHTAFHERLQRETTQARASLATLATGTPADGHASDDLALLLLLLQEVDETETDTDADTLKNRTARLQREAAAAAERERSARAEAERQAAIEADMAQSLAHLRESVGSIRQEMARLERQAADHRKRESLEQARTATLGRTLQEQAGLYEVLLGGEAAMEA